MSMKIAIEIELTDYYSVVFSDFIKDIVQLKNKRWTNPYRQKAQHPGCYAFYAGGKCLYIGKSSNAVVDNGSWIIYVLPGRLTT